MEFSELLPNQMYICISNTNTYCKLSNINDSYIFEVLKTRKQINFYKTTNEIHIDILKKIFSSLYIAIKNNYNVSQLVDYMLECTEETNYVPLINGEFQYPSLKSNTEKCNILLKFKLIDNNVLLIEESFH